MAQARGIRHEFGLLRSYVPVCVTEQPRGVLDPTSIRSSTMYTVSSSSEYVNCGSQEH